MIPVLLALILPAFAAYDVRDKSFIDGGRPLIEDFLAAKNRDYGSSLTVAPDSWAVRTVTSRLHPLDWAVLFGHRLNGECREVSGVVDVKTGARARFNVRLIRAPKTPARFDLVADCAKAAGAPIPLRIDGLTTRRIFSRDEFAAIATPLIKTLLRAQGRAADFEAADLQIAKSGVDFDNGVMRRVYRKFAGRTRAMDRLNDDDDRGSFSWVHRQIFGRNLACRRVRVALPAQGVILKTFVSVWYHSDELRPDIAPDFQALVLDRATMSPYRFALVDGCDRFGLFEAPTLKLITVPTAINPPPSP